MNESIDLRSEEAKLEDRVLNIEVDVAALTKRFDIAFAILQKNITSLENNFLLNFAQMSVEFNCMSAVQQTFNEWACKKFGLDYHLQVADELRAGSEELAKEILRTLRAEMRGNEDIADSIAQATMRRVKCVTTGKKTNALIREGGGDVA